MPSASAPGSLMLLGEYAVLHRQHALVCAIDKRMHVTLTPRHDSNIIIESALGHYETTLMNLHPVQPFQFVLTALHSMRKYLRQGFHLHIASEFSATVGFASSAAVTVATLKVLSQQLGMHFSSDELIKRARNIVRAVQGSGSGADVAACVLGGVVLYRTQPFTAKKMACTFPISVVYCGYKTPTAVAIQQVTQRFSNYPDIFTKLLQAINQCTLRGAAALTSEDWKSLGAVMNIQQGLMDALGVNSPDLTAIIQMLRRQAGILGAKISGSGLGDCVVALGDATLDSSTMLVPDAAQIRVNMSSEGVRCEKD